MIKIKLKFLVYKFPFKSLPELSPKVSKWFGLVKRGSVHNVAAGRNIILAIIIEATNYMYVHILFCMYVPDSELKTYGFFKNLCPIKSFLTSQIDN